MSPALDVQLVQVRYNDFSGVPTAPGGRLEPKDSGGKKKSGQWLSNAINQHRSKTQ